MQKFLESPDPWYRYTMKTSLMDGHQVGVCTGGAQISIGHDNL